MEMAMNNNFSPLGEEGKDLVEDVAEDILDEIADLEEYAAMDKRPPHCRGYRIRVNRAQLEIHERTPTREEILTKAGLKPASDWTLRIKLRGGKSELVKPGERVDLRRHGIEKFKALPRDQMEG
jgi:hypothetical protein